MRPLTPRERRLTALAILFLIVMAAGALVVVPVASGFSARAAQRDALRQAYVRNAAFIAMLPALRRRVETQRRVLARFAVLAPNAATAGDRLKERLRVAFEAGGGQVSGIDDGAASAGVSRAGVEGRLSLDQLMSLLARLQNEPPYLVIESLRISADRAMESGRLDILDVRIEASIPFVAAAA